MATTGPALTVALRIQSDMAQAVRDLDKVSGKITDVGKAAATTNSVGALPALANGTKQLDQFGVSAGQTANAIRQLPAQLTDVATQLAGGQNPLLVLLQQGGQVKDSFGGIRPALAALATYVTPVAVAVAGLAAGIGALAVAYAAGQADTKAYNIAVQSTANFAGATRGAIEALAEQASRSSGISKAAARDVATAMVQSGRLGIDTIGNLTRTVQGYAAATGSEVGRAGQQLTDLFAKPAEGAAKLNEQFHFLSAEQLRYIQQLVEQGRTEAAQLELSKRFSDHLGGAFVDNLGSLERAWLSVSKVAKGAWDSMLAVGRGATVEDDIANARKQVEQLQASVDKQRAQPGFGGTATNAAALAAAQARLQALELTKSLASRTAANDAEKAQTEQRRIELDKGIKGLETTLRTNRQKIEEEKKKLDEALKLKVIDQAQYDKLLAGVRDKFKGPKAAANPADSAFASQELSLTTQLAEAKNRLSNEVSGLADKENQATTKLDAWLTTAKEAKLLTEGRTAALRKLALEIDATNKRAADLDAGKKQQERIVDGLGAVNAQLLRATGNNAEATIAEIEARFRKLRGDLAATGNTQGLVQVDKLVGIETAKAQLAGLQQDVDRIFAAQGRAEQTLQAQVQAGLIPETAARQTLLNLHRQTVTQVEALLPAMTELAAKTEDPKLADGVLAVRAQTALLKIEADQLRLAFASAFEGSLSNALQGLATGTKSLGESAKGFLLDVAAGLARVAAQRLAEQAAAALTASLFGGAKTATDATGAASSAAAAAAISAAGTAAGTAIASSAIALDTSAAVVTVAATDIGLGALALDAAGAVVLTAAAAISVAAAELAAAAALAAVAGFATGGYTGPGHKYQPAGIVHAGEFVHRQEVVRQPNALAFLSDFNRVGMSALGHWSAAPGYASGGLVVPSQGMPAAPAYTPADPRSGATQVSVQQRLLPVLDDNLIADALRGPKGEELIVLHISRNPSKFRQLLKV